MRISHRMNSCLLILALVLIFACSNPKDNSKPEQQSSPRKSSTRLEQKVKELGWTGILTITPTPAENGKQTSFTLKLVDAKNLPLEEAKVHFSLLMPLMDMGKNEFEAIPAGQGRYLGKGQFSMEGIWIVQANIQKDRQSARLEFEVHVNEP